VFLVHIHIVKMVSMKNLGGKGVGSDKAVQLSPNLCQPRNPPHARTPEHNHGLP